MSKPCFKKGCTKASSFTCDCKSGIYFCKKHMGDHMLIQRPHNIQGLYVILDEPDEKKMKVQTEQIMKAYSELYIKAQKYSKTLIDSVLSSTKKLLDQIQKILSSASRINGCIYRSTPIDSEDLKVLESLNFQENFSFEFRIEKIVKMIEKEFDYNIERISLSCFFDDFAFYNDLNNHNINMIDTESLKLTTKAFKWSSLGKIGAAFKIQKDCYLAITTDNGAFNTGTPGQLLIKKIDFENATVEDVYNAGNLSGGGIVSINNILFCFTGIQNSYKFDIQKKEWTKISPIPQNCTYTSASYFQKKCYVTGYNLSYIYQFDVINNTYTSTLNISSGYFRYLLHEWVVCFNDSLYEIKDSTLIKHQNFRESVNTMFIYSGFKRGRFIYFIVKAGSILRIDTLKKIIKQLTVT